MIYGNDSTWHKTEAVDVEVDQHGRVVSVWFRCMALPFRQSDVGPERANDMIRMYKGAAGRSKLKAVDIELEKED